jgi:hypothetical protein
MTQPVSTKTTVLASVADSGKIRIGAGWGLLPPVRK